MARCESDSVLPGTAADLEQVTTHAVEELVEGVGNRSQVSARGRSVSFHI